MADHEDAAKRVVRLTKLFNAVIHGHREVKSVADGNRFLEALCAQGDVTKCVECLVAAPGGLSAIAKCYRFAGDSAFLNGPGASVLHHLSNPALKQLYSGQFLHRVLEAIVEPPTFWNTFVEAHHARILTDDATQAFAWLLFEILCAHSDTLPDVRDVAERITNNESLLRAATLEVRNLGNKIKHVLESSSSSAAEGPGGRHDNDFVDFRKVKILPTPDEFASAERPFYRRADAIATVDAEERGLLHLDNQFRLLREDFLGELRNDFQIATGKRKGSRKFILNKLQFEGVDCGTDSRRKPCSLKLRCAEDIPQMAQLKGTLIRKKFISDNKSLVKHESFGCLILEGKVLAFAKVERDEDLLAREPPIIVMRIVDESSFCNVLIASKSVDSLQFVQVDTADFAYRPILLRLQKMTEVPLQEQILDLDSGSSQVLSGIEPVRIVNEIKAKLNENLQATLGTTKRVELDTAQADSLLAGVTRKLSLIQGPPGQSSFLQTHTNE